MYVESVRDSGRRRMCVCADVETRSRLPLRGLGEDAGVYVVVEKLSWLPRVGGGAHVCVCRCGKVCGSPHGGGRV